MTQTIAQLLDWKHPTKVPASPSRVLNGTGKAVYDGDTLYLPEEVWPKLHKGWVEADLLVRTMEVIHIPKLKIEELLSAPFLEPPDPMTWPRGILRAPSDGA